MTDYTVIVERIDPKAGTRRPASQISALTLPDGIAVLTDYLKRRHKRKWFIFPTPEMWMHFTCFRFDHEKCAGEYLIVRLEATTISAN